MKLIFNIFAIIIFFLLLIIACMMAAGRADMKEEMMSLHNWRYCDDDCLNCKYSDWCRMSEVRIWKK